MANRIKLHLVNGEDAYVRASDDFPLMDLDAFVIAFNEREGKHGDELIPTEQGFFVNRRHVVGVSLVEVEALDSEW